MDYEDIYVMGPQLVTPGRDVDVNYVTAESYKKKLRINIVNLSNVEMEFDIIGIYPGLINALRRILISEVPTMAIEKVHIYNNTSLIQDEVLAHRLGLIPLKADARCFDYHNPALQKYSDKDSLHFELYATCCTNPNARFGHHRPEDKYVNNNVYSSNIKWTPVEGQANLFREELLGPVDADILISKLRPGQEIQAVLIAVKGIGRDHAKFSPVAAAAYRLHPFIHLKEEIEGDLAESLQYCFCPGVIDLKDSNGKVTAVVQNARLDSCSRNFMRHANLKDKVIVGRLPEHYIFSVESCTGLTPDELVKEAIKILKKKCQESLLKLQVLLN